MTIANGCSNVAKLNLKKKMFKKKICMYDFYKIFFFSNKNYLFKINICMPFEKNLILKVEI